MRSCRTFGHYELAVEAPANQRLPVAFNELAVAI
jgi:hypothetical protein